MKFQSDIDIDFADRQQILRIIRHVPASIDAATAHNTGVYVTEIPCDPVSGRATIDYRHAEQRGYVKLDFLNVNVYSQVRDELDLIDLMSTTPPWAKLRDSGFCQQLIHIGNHYDTIMRMPEPVDSIPRLAMLLAVIRPGKRHLIGKPWSEVAKTVWDSSDSEGYVFKKSHSVAYSHLVVVHMNLLDRASNQGN
jgi:hypothetical protein